MISYTWKFCEMDFLEAVIIIISGMHFTMLFFMLRSISMITIITLEDTIENMNLDYAVRVRQLILATFAELSEITERYSPLTPEKPSGPTPGKINAEYSYTTSTTDQQQDQIYYWFDWGDGTNSGWIGSYESGNTADASHTWNKKGSYVIKVKAKDTESHESDWSDPLPITMPYSYNNLILQFFECLFQRFPHIFPILRQLE